MTLLKLIPAVMVFTTHRAASQTFPLDKPEFRYKPWQELNATSQDVAGAKLGYTSITWNVHGLADIERKGWWQMTDEQKEGAAELGYDEETWDCFIDHYNSYDWTEIVEYNISQPLEALGWNESSWNGETKVPESEGKWWEQLSNDEQTAATQICFFLDNWNEIDMNPNPDGIFPHPKPDFRYVPWDELPNDTRDVAESSLGYDESTWNNPGTNRVERDVFGNLDSAQREGALEIGFYTHTWDCFMNHYGAYYWDSFYGDLLTAVESLGWTEASWNEEEGSSPPATQTTYWKDLSQEQKDAATKMCYFEETWDSSRSIQAAEPPQSSSAYGTPAPVITSAIIILMMGVWNLIFV